MIYLHTLHAQIPLACWVMWTPELAANRLIAKTPASIVMLCISAGYFIYDAAVSIVRYEGLAYLVHGVIAGILYTYGAMTGFLSYYGEAPSHQTQPAKPCMRRDVSGVPLSHDKAATCPADICRRPFHE